MAIVDLISGKSRDKTPGIIALGILGGGVLMIGWLHDWPKLLAHRFRGSSKVSTHPRVRIAQDISGPSGNPEGVTPIAYVRKLAGSAPRQFPGELKKYLHISKPTWLGYNFTDELHGIFRHQESIRREGKIVWAAVVQANSLLFRDDGIDCPASIIYSQDPWFDDRPEQLSLIARALFALKGTTPRNPVALRFANMLTNEMDRAMGLKAPTALSQGRDVFHSSIVLPRKHLPHRVLSGSYMPVFLDQGGSGEVILVPAAYWPPFLLSNWKLNPF